MAGKRSRFETCRISFRKTGIHFSGKCSKGSQTVPRRPFPPQPPPPLSIRFFPRTQVPRRSGAKIPTNPAAPRQGYAQRGRGSVPHPMGARRGAGARSVLLLGLSRQQRAILGQSGTEAQKLTLAAEAAQRESSSGLLRSPRAGQSGPSRIKATVKAGKLSGTKLPVPRRRGSRMCRGRRQGRRRQSQPLSRQT